MPDRSRGEIGRAKLQVSKLAVDLTVLSIATYNWLLVVILLMLSVKE